MEDNKDFFQSLKNYFETTPREEILADWDKSKEWDKIGPTVEEFLKINNNQQYYYIQNGYVGNAICWWAKDSHGYTTDIRNAHKYSKQEAINICITRKDDRAWPVDYIDNNLQSQKLVIDMQYLNSDLELKLV